MSAILKQRSDSEIGFFRPAEPLESIAPSKTNPRKHFDQGDLEELAKSIAEKGVIQPIVVRPHPQETIKLRWEIVAGERRYRASRIAGASTILVIARDLDDKAMLEIQVIENLQRVDVHPLDEAIGFKQLMELHGYTADTLAAKVGKSESYIYSRLKLDDLIPAIQKLFTTDMITAGHAILIARLSPDEQKQVIDKDNGLLWENNYRSDDNSVVSVRGLAAAIKQELYLSLAKVPWKTNDTKLLPAAGPCTTCPKRSGANPGLFAEIAEKDICTDRQCYNQKLDLFVARQMENGGLVKVSTDYNKKDVPADTLKYGSYVDLTYRNDACKFAQKAIITEGHTRGTTLFICSNKECPKHFGRSSSSSGDSYVRQEKARQKKKQAESERRARIFRAVMDKAPKKLERADLELIAKSSWKRLMNETQRVVMKVHGGLEPQKSQHGFECDKPAYKFIEAATDAELVKFMLATALGPDLSVNAYAETAKPEILLGIAKRLKVNVDKISAELNAELKAKQKKKPKVQTSAKGKTAAAPPDPEDPEADEDEFLEED